MLIEDHINLMGTNPLIGDHHPIWGARFPDLTHCYDRELQDTLEAAAHKVGLSMKRGVYASMLGPNYETPAEVRMIETLGANAVGMSTVPSTILAKSAGIRVLAMSCITNYAAGLSGTPLTHSEVMETSKSAMVKITELFSEFMNQLHV